MNEWNRRKRGNNYTRLNVEFLKAGNVDDENGWNGGGHGIAAKRRLKCSNILSQTDIIIIINSVRISTIYGHQAENYVFDCVRAIQASN